MYTAPYKIQAEIARTTVFFSVFLPVYRMKSGAFGFDDAQNALNELPLFASFVSGMTGLLLDFIFFL
jgi:hypothetical protein